MHGLLAAWVAVTFLQVGGAPPDLKCGSQCLYVSLKALDIPVGSFSELEAKLGQPTAQGYSMGQLADAAESFGAKTLGVETTFDNLRRRPSRFACMALVDNHHFVNLTEVGDTHVHVIDPPRDYTLPLETLRSMWDGKALLISNEALLAEEDLPRPPQRWIAWLVLILLGAAAAAVWVKRRLAHD